MRISRTDAEKLLRDEAAKQESKPIDSQWLAKIEKFSELCSIGNVKTHIAFLGTLILAKAIENRVDLYAVKPTRAKENKNAFSARTFCHSVLVPLAPELGIDIGATGREPLNNAPYINMNSLGDLTPIHGAARPAFDYMLELVKELQGSTSDHARRALRAFIIVRKRYQKKYVTYDGKVSITGERLLAAIKIFVQTKSERGRRAQAVVAGLLDVFAGAENVMSGRVNDPSRRYPGDVLVHSAAEPAVPQKAIEVRDKQVTESDVRIFANRCREKGLQNAAVVMVSPDQKPLNTVMLCSWASECGIGLTLFHGWEILVEQTLFWASTPGIGGASAAAEFIGNRLREIEVASETLDEWFTLLRSTVV